MFTDKVLSHRIKTTMRQPETPACPVQATAYTDVYGRFYRFANAMNKVLPPGAAKVRVLEDLRVLQALALGAITQHSDWPDAAEPETSGGGDE